MLNQRLRKSRIYEVGVQRASCLGPLLFPFSIDNLPLVLQGSNFSMYVDSISLCYQSNDVTLLIEAINNDMKNLDSWLQSNRLSSEYSKSTLHASTY